MDTPNVNSIIKDWVNQYSDGLYSWALHKTSNKETAEDLVQDSFLAALQSIEKFEERSNPKTWLFSILNHKISDHFRSLYRKPLSFDSAFVDMFFDENNTWKKDSRPQAWDEESIHLLDNQDFNAILASCIGKLPENWNAAIQLKYFEEKDAKDICQELEVSPTNFWQIVHRAKLQLRKCLELNWFKKQNHE